jgi:hypothetical protein
MEEPMIFVGIDWAEAQHDVRIVDAEGRPLAGGRVPEGLDGVGRVQAMVGAHAADPAEVVVGIETDRGLLVGALEAFGTDLAAPDALAVLGHAPTPAAGRALRPTTLRRLLRAGGRQRRIAARAAELRAALQAPQLEAAAAMAAAYGATVRAAVRVIAGLNAQIATLEAELAAVLARHPDAPVLSSLPGLGPVLGAGVLGEFGDDPARYATPKARKAYAGTAPITRASGTRLTVLARVARNRHLADACYLWAFAALRASPGARGAYDAHRDRGQTHHQALRALANRLVGILHGCLVRRDRHREEVAWPRPSSIAA